MLLKIKNVHLHCTNDRLNLNSLMSRLRLQHFETFSQGLVFLETFPILVLFSVGFPSSFTYFDQHEDRCFLTGSGLQLWNIAFFSFFLSSCINLGYGARKNNVILVHPYSVIYSGGKYARLLGVSFGFRDIWYQ